MAGGAAVAGPRVRCDLVHDDGTHDHHDLLVEHGADMDHQHHHPSDDDDLDHRFGYDVSDLIHLRDLVRHGHRDHDDWRRRLNTAPVDVRAAYWRTVLAGHWA